MHESERIRVQNVNGGKLSFKLYFWSELIGKLAKSLKVKNVIYINVLFYCLKITTLYCCDIFSNISARKLYNLADRKELYVW